MCGVRFRTGAQAGPRTSRHPGTCATRPKTLRRHLEAGGTWSALRTLRQYQTRLPRTRASALIAFIFLHAAAAAAQTRASHAWVYADDRSTGAALSNSPHHLTKLNAI